MPQSNSLEELYELPYARFAMQTNPMGLDMLKDPEVRCIVPGLRKAFEELKEGNENPAITRSIQMPNTLTPYRFVYPLLFNAEAKGIPYAIIDQHAPAFSAQKNEEILEEYQADIEAQIGETCVLKILKTVSIDYRGFTLHGRKPLVIAAGIGNFEMSRQQLIAIARRLDPFLSNKKAKSIIINPEDCITTTLVGCIPGMLKPMLHPLHAMNVSGIAYFSPQELDGYVAFTVSPIDSIVVPVSYFEWCLRRYASEAYGRFTHTKDDEFDMWINETGASGLDVLFADIPEEYEKMIMKVDI